MDLARAVGQFALEHGVPVVASWDAERGELAIAPLGHHEEHRPAEGSRESSSMINSAGRADNEILEMHKRGRKIGHIAEDLGVPLREVVEVIQSARRGPVDPTPEEIAERATAIRRAKGILEDE